MHPPLWCLELGRDLRYALRSLRRTPLFTAVVLLTIALGIGVSTAVFTVVNDVLLRGLPYPAERDVVVIWNETSRDDTIRTSIAAAEFADIREADTVFDQVAGIRSRPGTLTGGCDDASCDAEQVNAYVVSPNLFELLGVRPRVGRPFTPADGADEAPGVVMLSHALWHRRFAGDPSAVGRHVEIAGVVHTIIGVMPAHVRFPDVSMEGLPGLADLWTPYDWTQARSQGRGNQILAMVARMRAGASRGQAQADLDVVAGRFRATFERYTREPSWRLAAVSLRRQTTGDVQPQLLVLLGAVLVVLVMACANVANLQLARGQGRSSEIAVRIALGASRGRIVRLLLAESFLIAALGGTAGLGLASLGLDALVALDPASIPHLAGPSIDASVLAFALMTMILTALLVGLGPALRGVRLPSPFSAPGQGKVAADPSGRISRLLVVAEVALAIVVLAGAGLLVRSFTGLMRVDPGFEPASAVVFQLSLPRARYDSRARALDFHHQLVERLGAIPGASAATAIYPMPMSGEGWSGTYHVEGEDDPEGQPEPHAEYNVVLPGAFQALGVPLLEGRDFSAADGPDAPRVAIVDETLARAHWPGESALGRQILPNGPAATIIGVVPHVRRAGPRSVGEGQIYQPVAQRVEYSLYYVVSASQTPESLLSSVRPVVRHLDPQLPVARLTTGSDLIASFTSRERFAVTIFVVLGTIALILAAVGLYGVMAHLVSLRRREVGVRLALGGSPASVRRRIMAESMLLVAIGVVLGLVATVQLSPVMAGMLFEVGATDAATYGAITLLVALVTATAAYVPARRASAVDPAEVLRSA